MPKVFLSYVRDNQPIVERLAADLARHGVSTWYDKNDIPPGSRWADAIRKGIQNGDYFIACFSAEYARRNKSYMNEELALAVEELRQRSTDATWFIPVKLSPCDVPDRKIAAGETLRDLQWVDLYEKWDDGLQRILSVIRPTGEPFHVSSALIDHTTHGVRSALARIRRRVELLNDGTPDRERETSVIISLAAFAMLGMQNFRAAAHVSQKKEPLYLSVIDLGSEVEKVWSLFRPTFERGGPERRIGIDLQPDPLWQAVMADPSMISQVFYNLIDNALKYSFSNTRIVIDGRGSSGEEAIVNFRNEGISIAPSESSLIFQPGFRTPDAESATGGGSGLGLYISRMIVERHGGRLEYTKGGENTHHFQVRLPINGPSTTT